MNTSTINNFINRTNKDVEKYQSINYQYFVV
mgnify:CR=1 FL=1